MQNPTSNIETLPAPTGVPGFLGIPRTSHRDRTIADMVVVSGFMGDAIAGLLSLLCGFWLRFQCLPAFGMAARNITLPVYQEYIAVGLLGFLACLTWSGIYNPKLLLNFGNTMERVLRGFFLWLFLFLAAALLFQMQPALSAGFVCLSACAMLATVLTWRWAFHRYVSTSGMARHLRQRIVFVGWTAEAGRFAQLVWENQTDPYEIVGYVEFAPGHEQLFAPANVPYLGDYRDLDQILHADEIDVALLTDLNAGSAAILQLATVCEKEMVEFKIIPSYFRILVSGLHLETISGIPVLGTDGLPLNHLHNRVLKRLVDILGAVAGIVLAAPIIAIFAFLVYRESPGQVFYRQRRLGQKGRLFDMIKIRSMRLDAEKDGRIGWSTKTDSRRLKIGGFMRKWNIDELPQFWNVIKGDMSLVGPRPERPELIKDFKHQIPHYNARHSIKPGITGWAQVHGLRGDTDLSERIQHDLFYMENWNVFLDVQTMILTFFKRENAC